MWDSPICAHPYTISYLSVPSKMYHGTCGTVPYVLPPPFHPHVSWDMWDSPICSPSSVCPIQMNHGTCGTVPYVPIHTYDILSACSVQMYHGTCGTVPHVPIMLSVRPIQMYHGTCRTVPYVPIHTMISYLSVLSKCTMGHVGQSIHIIMISYLSVPSKCTMGHVGQSYLNVCASVISMGNVGLYSPICPQPFICPFYP